MNARTGNCPVCGAEIAASLVAAILDPRQEESCPKAVKR